MLTYPLKARTQKKKKSKTPNNKTTNEIMEPIFFMKRIGFSFDEMAVLTTDDYLDLVEIYADYNVLNEEGSKAEEVIEAGQDQINSFFGN